MGIVSVLSSLALDFCQHMLVKSHVLYGRNVLWRDIRSSPLTRGAGAGAGAGAGDTRHNFPLSKHKIRFHLKMLICLNLFEF